MLVLHCHCDHIGNICSSVPNGFKGRLICNKPNEKLLLRQANENHEVVFFVTCNKMIGQYYLYKVKDGKSKKVKTSDTIDFKELEV